MSRALSLALALCLSACAAPDLDLTGPIRCGAATELNGGCPEGSSCSAGRCCATSLNETTCPPLASLALACDGRRVDPFPAGQVPAACNQASQLSVGAPCANAGDCAMGARLCAPTLPGGYCTAGCESQQVGATCGPSGEGLCVRFGAGRICARRCSLPAGELVARCRGDGPGAYVCAQITGVPEPLCLPDCFASPGVCGANNALVCDRRTHVCTPRDCRDPGVTCDAGEVCSQSSGQCSLDCRATPCPAGQACDTSVGACVAGDRCVGVTCPLLQRCVNGACVRLLQ